MLQINIPEMSIVASNDRTYCEVEYTGLIRGVGHSLGNAVRRTLLGYIPGYAPLGYQMFGVSAFSSIPGIIEDENAVGQNVAGIKVKVLDNNIEFFTLNFYGNVGDQFNTGDFTSIMGEVPPNYRDGKAPKEYYDLNGNFDTEKFYKKNVRILNPNHKLFTNGGEEGLKKDLSVIFGNGVYFITAEDRSKVEKCDGWKDCITVNSVFSPVLKVNYEVIPDKKFTETLKLCVRTTGATSPTDAIHMAFELLFTYSSALSSVSMVNTDENFSIPVGAPYNKEEKPTVALAFGGNDLQMPIEEIVVLQQDSRWSEITHNLMKVAGYNCLGDIVTGFRTGDIEDLIKKDFPYTKEEFIQKLVAIGVKEIELLSDTLMS